MLLHQCQNILITSFQFGIEMLHLKKLPGRNSLTSKNVHALPLHGEIKSSFLSK